MIVANPDGRPSSGRKAGKEERRPILRDGSSPKPSTPTNYGVHLLLSIIVNYINDCQLPLITFNSSHVNSYKSD